MGHQILNSTSVCTVYSTSMHVAVLCTQCTPKTTYRMGIKLN